MRKPILTACSAGLIALVTANQATAHAVAGNRFFPATLTTDDPGVADELSMPTLSSFKTADDPSARELDISGEYSKRLTSTLGVSVGDTWTRLTAPGSASDLALNKVAPILHRYFPTDRDAACSVDIFLAQNREDAPSD